MAERKPVGGLSATREARMRVSRGLRGMEKGKERREVALFFVVLHLESSTFGGG